MFDGNLWRPLKLTVSEREGADAALIALRRALRPEDLDDDPLFARFCETLRREDSQLEERRANLAETRSESALPTRCIGYSSPVPTPGWPSA